jgi:hypothetical protein
MKLVLRASKMKELAPASIPLRNVAGNFLWPFAFN